MRAPPRAPICRGFSRAAGGGFWPEVGARTGQRSFTAGELFSSVGADEIETQQWAKRTPSSIAESVPSTVVVHIDQPPTK
jgi:hypothetical protein